MSRFFKSAAFPILIVVVLAFFAQKLISPGATTHVPNYSEFVTQVNQGQVKGIAVLSETRVPISPDIPTSGEQGLPGVESSVWNAFFVPKGTPEPIIRKLNKAMSDTLDDANIRKRLEELGLVIVPHERRTPEYLAKFLPQDIAKWGKVIQAAGISAD